MFTLCVYVERVYIHTCVCTHTHKQKKPTKQGDKLKFQNSAAWSILGEKKCRGWKGIEG